MIEHWDWPGAGFLERPLGVGEFAASQLPNEVLSVHGLGSCVGVGLYDSEVRVAGMAHVQFPTRDHRLLSQAEVPDGAFADQALPKLLSEMEDLGADRGRLRVYLIGASNDAFFGVGPQNYEACLKALEGVGAARHEEVGGHTWRSLKLVVGSGRSLLISPEGRKELAE